MWISLIGETTRERAGMMISRARGGAGLGRCQRWAQQNLSLSWCFPSQEPSFSITKSCANCSEGKKQALSFHNGFGHKWGLFLGNSPCPTFPHLLSNKVNQRAELGFQNMRFKTEISSLSWCLYLQIGILYLYSILKPQTYSNATLKSRNAKVKGLWHC